MTSRQHSVLAWFGLCIFLSRFHTSGQTGRYLPAHLLLFAFPGPPLPTPTPTVAPCEGCIRRKGTSRSPHKCFGRRLEEVAKAVGGRLLSVITAVEVGVCHQGDSGWVQAGRPGGGGGHSNAPPPPAAVTAPRHKCNDNGPSCIARTRTAVALLIGAPAHQQSDRQWLDPSPHDPPPPFPLQQLFPLADTIAPMGPSAEQTLAAFSPLLDHAAIAHPLSSLQTHANNIRKQLQPMSPKGR